jgi:hypothetical protein
VIHNKKAIGRNISRLSYLSAGVALLFAFSSCCKKEKLDPIPRVGDQLHSDYKFCLVVEGDENFVKYRMGPFLQYYVICDHSGKILSVSVWKTKSNEILP